MFDFNEITIHDAIKQVVKEYAEQKGIMVSRTSIQWQEFIGVPAIPLFIDIDSFKRG